MKLDVVVNCAGLRATELVEDAEVYPLRGVLVHQLVGFVSFYVSDASLPGDAQATISSAQSCV